jgi:cytochrome b6-f complex iron-sulfur subunit
MSFNRRNFLVNGWKVGAGVLALAAGWTSWDLFRPLKAGGASGKIPLGSPSDFAAGTATFVNAGRLWVANADGHLFALAQRCPHLGCRVPFCESSGRFECPCHGSVFDLGGEWITGPSPRGMDQHPLSVENDTLIVDVGVVIQGPDHGASAYLTPPKGPSCVGQG